VADSREIFDLFRDCGRVTRFDSGKPVAGFSFPLGDCFLEFDCSLSAKKAVRLDGMVLNGRKLRVEFAWTKVRK